MALRTSFFPSISEDKTYNSKIMVDILAQLVQDGYVSGYLNQLNIYEDNVNKQIVVDSGAAFYKGHFYENTESQTLGIPLNTTPSTILMGVILRVNRNPFVRDITITQIQSSNGIDFIGDLNIDTLQDESGVSDYLMAEYEIAPGTQEAMHFTQLYEPSNAYGFAPSSVLDLFNQHIAKIVNENDGSDSGHLTGDMYKSLLDTDNQLLAQLAGATFSDDETSSSNSEFLSARAINQKIADSSLPSYLPEAQYIGYDNTVSGLTAENMQDALDEAYAQMGTATGSSSTLALGNARDIAYLLAMKEIDNRAIGYTQKFYNIPDLDVAVNCVLDDWQELLPSDVSVGQTVFSGLTDTSTLGVGKELTIQDSLSKEYVTIVSIDSTTQITVTATTDAYTQANGGVIYRSYGDLGITWDKETDMIILPDSDGWSVVQSGTPSFTITDGVLNLVTNSDDLLRYEIESGNVLPINTKVVETFVKVNSNGGDSIAPSQMINIADGVNSADIYIERDKISYFNGTTSVLIGSVDLNTEFKKVRIEVDNVNGVNVYVNDILLGNVPYASLYSNTNNKIAFGDFSATSPRYNADVEYDYIYYTLEKQSTFEKLSPFDKRYKVDLPADTLVAWTKKDANVQSLSSSIATLNDGETETYVAMEESNYGTSELQSEKIDMDETKTHSVLKYEVTYDTNGEVGDIDRILGVTDIP